MSDKEPVISIDFKTRKRIRIHKITFHLLNDPKYIQILVNPESKAIALRAGDPDDPLSLRINQRAFADNSYEVCSLGLTESLMHLYEDWQEGRSYRIYGDFIEKEKIAVFYIKNMKEIKESR